MSYSKVIVTTTINPPTEALLKFAAAKGWHLCITGDLKTPTPYHVEGATYLGPKEQEKLAPKLSELIGWNCMQRRNMGFVWAAKQGATQIATVDDDNIPYAGWGENSIVNTEIEVDYVEATSVPCFDPVFETEHKNLWHRGYPIQWLTNRAETKKTKKKIRVDVEAGFWNGDPDIDAICRMEHKPNVTFKKSSFPIAG